MNGINYNKLYSTNITEAVLDAAYFDKETGVNIPHDFAVEAAKEWIEENEK